MRTNLNAVSQQVNNTILNHETKQILLIPCYPPKIEISMQNSQKTQKLDYEPSSDLDKLYLKSLLNGIRLDWKPTPI